MQRRHTRHSNTAGALQAFLVILWSAATAAATEPSGPAFSPTNIFAPVSTPARSIFDLSVLVLTVTATIFVGIGCLAVHRQSAEREYSGPQQRAGDVGDVPHQLVPQT